LGTCMNAQAETTAITSDNSALAATPYRPTVSNPAELPVPGYLELEVGWSQSRSDDSHSKSMQYLAKYAFNPHWGVLIGGDAWTSRRGLGDTQSGRGDTFLLAKHLFDLDLPQQDLGLEVGVNLPTAKQGLGSAQTDYLLNGIHSLDLTEDWRLDTNLGVTHLGAADANAGRNVLLWVSCLGYSTGKLGYALELSGTHQSNVANTKQVLLALSYAVTPRLVLDAAYIHMQQDSARENMLLVGATWLVGKLF
ncbi:MAG TPA: hypothetical protein VGD04_09055, partial [Methylophilus sp.]